MLASFLPYSFLLLGVMVLGTLTGLSSSCWLGAWVGLEINLIGFIPILVYGGSMKEGESGILYFIVQSLGSGLLMVGSLISFDVAGGWDVSLYEVYPWSLVVTSMSLMLKLGSFPFHSWFPKVMAGGSWFSCLLLVTWQKVGPLFLLNEMIWSWSNCESSTFGLSGPKIFLFLLIVGSLGSLIGGVGGINQTEVRALLAYSSIGHIGWMVFCCLLGWGVLLNYFVFYFFISVCFFVALWRFEGYSHLRMSVGKSEESKFSETSVILMLLSLGGMPPLLGFYPKLVVILECCWGYGPVYLSMLILGSLISLYYYLSLLFSVSLHSFLRFGLEGGDSWGDKTLVKKSFLSKSFNFAFMGPIFAVNSMGCIALVFTPLLGMVL
uniref:NADH-ubiquinone oxidoreductase chain 2 n=1 Tax=Phasianella solida TaxID=335754 RepID=A0A0S1F5Q0_9VEST|nr:NADH dehydrogenase subunit 2 [Phasianella solida]ALK03401.1 NADH dehydrogenase subunit 2 [Phasianella solida]